MFSASFDEEKNDWKISITAPKTTKIDSELRTETFWWCGGRFLPEEELLNTDKYWTVLYNYPTTLEDPKDFDEEKTALKKAARTGPALRRFFSIFCIPQTASGQLKTILCKFVSWETGQKSMSA